MLLFVLKLTFTLLPFSLQTSHNSVLSSVQPACPPSTYHQAPIRQTLGLCPSCPSCFPPNLPLWLLTGKTHLIQRISCRYSWVSEKPAGCRISRTGLRHPNSSFYLLLQQSTHSVGPDVKLYKSSLVPPVFQDFIDKC